MMTDEHVIAEFLHQVSESRKSGKRPANADILVAQLIGMVGRHSPLKPRAIEALSKTDWPLAINFLSALTPPGMAFIPAGEFTMGSDENADEKPPHQVWVDSFYIDRGPLTNKQFGGFWEEVPYATASEAWAGF